MQSLEFVVDRHNLDRCRIVERALPDPGDLNDGALLLRVERFAFTANNITYAMLGDELKYWSLFAAPDGHGMIPVWGLAEVIASRHDEVRAGERLFGYLPMASHLVVEATAVTAKGLRDGAAHRQQVSPVYNAYARVSGDDAYAGRAGDQQALIRPLLMLSFVVDDDLAEHDFYGARRVILSSASSKTAFTLAHLLTSQRRPVEVVGLTASGHKEFAGSLGCYHEVLAYDEIERLPADGPAAFVDMAGNAGVRARLHRRLADRLLHSSRVGLTHQQAVTEDQDLPGPTPTWFFAPDRIRKRVRDWGGAGFEARFAAIWPGTADLLNRALTIVESAGPAALERVYRDTREGRISPRDGHILTLAG